MSRNLPSQTSDLIASALQLSAADRVALAAALLESVDDIADEPMADASTSWQEEIRQRVEEIDSAKVETIPSSEMWKRLGGKPDDGN